jgi:hypothetical protein
VDADVPHVFRARRCGEAEGLAVSPRMRLAIECFIIDTLIALCLFTDLARLFD